MRRVDPSSLVMPPVGKKDIEFVIPPTFCSTPSSRPGATPINQKITVSNNPFNNDFNKIPKPQSQPQPIKKQENSQEQKSAKGWDFLSTVFNASASLKEGAQKGRSKEAPALLISTADSSGLLDVPNVKTARSASLTVNSLGVPVNPNASNSAGSSSSNSRRGSKVGLNLLAAGDSGMGGRRLSKGSLFTTGGSASPKNQGSRRPSVSVEPHPECFAHFGGINPSLYLNPEPYEEKESFPENHLGRVFYSVYYDYITEELTVNIQRIKNLPKSTRESGITNKTYLKICLLPDERSERKITARKDDTFADLNPEFFDSVIFPVSIVDVTKRTLRLLVFNIDVNRKHRGLAQTILELSEVNLTHGKLNLNADLQRFIDSSELPELLLSISFNGNISRLTVNVVEGKFFKSLSSDDPPDTFIKLILMHHTKEKKTKKTEVIKKNGYPSYQESFNFKLEEEELESHGVKVVCFQKMPFPEKDRVLGTCILGGCMFARGKGNDHWEQMKKNQKSYFQEWHVLMAEVSDKNDSNKLSVDQRSRSRSNSGVLSIPKDFDQKRRRNSSIAIIDRR